MEPTPLRTILFSFWNIECSLIGEYLMFFSFTKGCKISKCLTNKSLS